MSAAGRRQVVFCLVDDQLEPPGDRTCERQNLVPEPETAFWQITILQPTGGPPWLPRVPTCAFFLAAQERFFRCVGDPSCTQLRDPADELHRNRFGEWE